MTALATTPDGADVVRNLSPGDPGSARPPLLVLDPLSRYLDDAGVPAGELAWRRIGDGQANVTYELRRGGERVVLRRGPRPPFPPSAHDMVREARVVAAVGAAGVPVPGVRAVCDDPAVVGAPFYLMELVEGEVVTDRLPAGFDGPGDRAALVHAAVDALADLHAVPLDGDVAALGRPDGYLDRQVRRFAQLWPLNTRRAVPRVEELGDPLADLGYLVATYSAPGAAPTPMDLTPVTAGPGFPSRASLVDRYAARTGADVSVLPWYEALALWKSAIFCEAMYTRWLDGQRPDDDFAPALADGVPALAEAAEHALARHEQGHERGDR